MQVTWQEVPMEMPHTVAVAPSPSSKLSWNHETLSSIDSSRWHSQLLNILPSLQWRTWTLPNVQGLLPIPNLLTNIIFLFSRTTLGGLSCHFYKTHISTSKRSSCFAEKFAKVQNMWQRGRTLQTKVHALQNPQLRTARGAHWLGASVVWCANAAWPGAYGTVCRSSQSTWQRAHIKSVL